MTTEDSQILERARSALPWDAERRAEIYWRHRFAGTLERAELRVLELERNLTRVASDLDRTRHRRWWQIGAALGEARQSWRGAVRAPGRLARSAFGSHQLPPPADTSELERQIAAQRAASTAVHSAEVALANRRYEEADQRSAEALDADPLDYGALHVRAQLARSLGELTIAHRYVRLLADIHPTGSLEAWAAALRGQIIATDPAWLPDVPGAVEPLVDRVEGRILHLLKESLPFYERGYTVRSHANMVAARDAGFEPVVVTALGFPRSDGHSSFEPTETIDGIRHHRLDLGPEYDPLRVQLDQYLADWAWQAARLVRDERPAAIHAGSGHHGFDAALVGLALARHFDLPMIYEVRSALEQTWTGDAAVAESGEYFDRRIAQENRCMLEADLVLAISEAQRADLERRGVPPGRTFTLPNGVDVDRFRALPKPERLAARYGFGTEPVIGYVSNLGTREGVETLIRATARLRDQGISVRCLVVGDGPRRTDLEALIDELALGLHVQLAGQVPQRDIAEHYALIDVFVVPRTNDRAARLITPLKPFEAMAMGIPLVVSKLDALVEIVGEDRGLTFDPESAESLAAVLGDLLPRRDRMRAIGEAGRTWVTAERTWSANGPRLADAYTSIGVKPS